MAQLKKILIAMLVVCALSFTLVACNEKAKVTFDVNGGTGEAYTVETTKDELLEMPEDPVRSGYVFNGWKNGDSFWNFTKDRVSADMTLVADWTKTCTVTYTLGDLEGTAPEAETVKIGEEVTLPEAPAIENQEFAGWKVGEETKAAGDKVAINADVTVVALWIKQCDVTYSLGNMQGNAPASQTVDFGTSINLPAAPEIKGYTFKGWQVGDVTKAEGSEIVVETDLTVTANYAINTYTVNYYGFYGEVVFSEKVEFGSAATYDGVPTGSGSRFVAFAGWSETDSLEAVEENLEVYSLWRYPQSDDKYFNYVESNGGYLVEASAAIADFEGDVIFLPAEYNGKLVTGIVAKETADEDVPQETAFGTLNVAEVVVPSSYKTIGAYAFYGNENIQTVTFESKGLTSIGNYAFAGTSNLSEFTFPATVETIGDYAFAYDGSLANNNTGVDDDRSSLKEFKVEEGSVLKSIGVNAFAFAGFESLTIPASVETVSDYAFYAARGIKTLTFEEGSKLTSIGQYAFSGDDGTSWTGLTAGLLQSVELPASLKTLGTGAFFRQQFTNIVLNEGLETVGDRAFGTSATKYSFFETLYIPASVTTIGDYAFRSCGSLGVITFAEGGKLESIGDYAFYDCNSLETVTIPNTVKYIGEQAFYNAYSLKAMNFEEGNTENGLEFGEGFLQFSDRTALNVMTSFTFPARTTTISKNAFYYRLGLTAINFEEGGTLDLTIGELAFVSAGSTNSVSSSTKYVPSFVKSLTIPARTVSIGKAAFNFMINLESLTFEEGSKLTEIPDNMAFGCVNLKTLVLPENLVSIGNYAFETGNYAIKYYNYIVEDGVGKTVETTMDHIGNTAMTSLTLPASLTKIGSYNFKNFMNLASVTFGDGTSPLTIDTYSFGIYNTLKDTRAAEVSVKFGKNISVIGAQVFVNVNIKSVEFPADCVLESIGNNAFAVTATKGVVTPPITTIALPASLTSISTTAFNGYDKLATFTVVGTGSLSAENGMLYLTDAETGKSLYRVAPGYAETSLTIEGIDGVAANAVNNVPAIESITVSGVKMLGNSCFANLENLETVSISGVETYGAGIFENDKALSNVTFTDGLTVVPESMFEGCVGLTTFDFANVTEIGNSAFFNTGFESVAMPNLVTLGNSAFSGCTKLTTVDLGKVTVLGSGVFQSCTALTSIDLTNITEMGANIFSGATKLATVTGLKVTELPASAFKGTSLTSVNFDSVVTVGNSAFANCKSLASVNLPNATKLDNNAFQNCSVLTSVSIPKAETFGTNAFQNCAALTTISLPATVTAISNYTFSGCSALEQIDLSNITTIGTYAFQNCKALTSVTIPAAVTTISANAFNGCANLKTLTLEGDTVKTLSATSAFTSTPFATENSGAKIVVKADLVEEYKVAKNWSTYAAYFVAAE